MFTPSNMLEKGLQKEPRDMYYIIGALMGYINADPAFLTDDFDHAIRYVLDHGISENELYSEFDPEMDFEEDPNKWNEEYYSYARVYLKENFCKKRISHVENVAKKVYEGKIPQRQRTSQEDEKETVSIGGQQSKRKKPQGQQYQNKEDGKKTIPRHLSARSISIIVVGVVVLLAIVIAVIMLKG